MIAPAESRALLLVPSGRELRRAGDARIVEGAVSRFAAPRVGRCSDSSDSAANGRAKHYARTAPLTRSRSFALRSWSWSRLFGVNPASRVAAVEISNEPALSALGVTAARDGWNEFIVAVGDIHTVGSFPHNLRP